MGVVFSTCASLLGFIDEDEFDVEEGESERLAVEELLQDAAGAGFPVEITIACDGLPDKDKFSKSDPFVVASTPTPEGRKMLGRTETVQNNLNPQFVMCIIDNYSPQEDHEIVFSVYHLSNPQEKEERQQLLGTHTMTLGELMKQKSGTFPLKEQTSSKKSGLIKLGVQKIKNVQEEITLNLSAVRLPRFGRSAPHPFLTINRVQQNTLVPVAKTNIAKSTTDPQWKTVRVKSFRLCRNDFNLPLQFQVHSGDPSGNHRYIGSAKSTLSTILSGAVKEFPIINERKLGKKGYVNSGEIVIGSVKRSAPNSFLDFVKAGAEINCTLAVDLSNSNYSQQKNVSLHYYDPEDPTGGDNDYIQALLKVCKVVGRYDKDQMFPIYGFGAVLPGTSQPCHCFPLTFNEEEPEVQGAEAVVDIYRRAVRAVEPIEPTHMAPVIRKVMKGISDSRDNTTEGEDAAHMHDMPSYQLLVIFTDGIIHDLTETIDAAVDASFQPMSILIVGMGDPHVQRNGFKLMRQLDNPDEPLRSVMSGRTIKRDIVNFMVFDEYKNATPNDFARGALAEIPSHFLSWVEMAGLSLKNIKHDGDVKADDHSPADFLRADHTDPTMERKESWLPAAGGADVLKAPEERSLPPDLGSAAVSVYSGSPTLGVAVPPAPQLPAAQLNIERDYDAVSTYSIPLSTKNDLLKAIGMADTDAAQPLLQAEPVPGPRTPTGGGGIDALLAEMGSAERVGSRRALQPPPHRPPYDASGAAGAYSTGVPGQGGGGGGARGVVNPYGPALARLKQGQQGDASDPALGNSSWNSAGYGGGGGSVVGTGGGVRPVYHPAELEDAPYHQQHPSPGARRNFRMKPSPAALEI